MGPFVRRWRWLIDEGGKCIMCTIVYFSLQMCCLFIIDGCISHSWALAEIVVIQRVDLGRGKQLSFIFKSHRKIWSGTHLRWMYLCNVFVLEALCKISFVALRSSSVLFRMLAELFGSFPWMTSQFGAARDGLIYFTKTGGEKKKKKNIVRSKNTSNQLLSVVFKIWIHLKNAIY